MRGVALSAASGETRGREMDGETEGDGIQGAQEAQEKVEVEEGDGAGVEDRKNGGSGREHRKRGRAGGDECAAIYSWLSTVWVCVHTCGSCGSGSFVRQPDLTASVTSHLEGGVQKHTFLDTVHITAVVWRPQKPLVN